MRANAVTNKARLDVVYTHNYTSEPILLFVGGRLRTHPAITILVLEPCYHGHVAALG